MSDSIYLDLTKRRIEISKKLNSLIDVKIENERLKRIEAIIKQLDYNYRNNNTKVK